MSKGAAEWSKLDDGKKNPFNQMYIKAKEEYNAKLAAMVMLPGYEPDTLYSRCSNSSLLVRSQLHVLIYFCCRAPTSGWYIPQRNASSLMLRSPVPPSL